MKQRVIIDTGPLIAFINRREHFHTWVINTLARIEQPLLTCEAVIVETCFLLRNIYGGQGTAMSMPERDLSVMLMHQLQTHQCSTVTHTT